MTRGIRLGTSWAVGVLGAMTLGAQDRAPEPRLAFEVASIKENTSGDSRSPMRTQPGGRFTATNVQLRFLIAVAYMDRDLVHLSSRILGGPDWIASTHYDITAKANTEFRPSPDGASRELLLMLRSLLEDRFTLKTHRETRELPIYNLVIARADGKLGPEMRPSTSNCDVLPPPRQPGEPPPCGAMGGPARIIAGGLPMDRFAAMITARLAVGPPSNADGRLVVDRTGLRGRFAFTLAWTPEQIPAEAPPPGIPPIDPNGPSFFTALQEQLGLKLEPARGPIDVLVIDSVERPTPD